MDVILTEDISTLGRRGDVVKVAKGYGRNYLIPQGLALMATPQNLKVIEERKKVLERKSEKLKEEAVDLSKKIEALTCELPVQAGDDDKLFGSVTSMDIEKFLNEKGFSIDKKDILLEAPIKSLGTASVPIALHPDVKAELKVTLIKE
jgi:large subunit ribosomal protein L9